MPFRHEFDIRRLLRLLRAELSRFQEYISPNVQRFKHYFVDFVTQQTFTCFLDHIFAIKMFKTKDGWGGV